MQIGAVFAEKHGPRVSIPAEARFESNGDQVGISDGNLKRSWVAMHFGGGGGVVVNHCARQPTCFYHKFDGLI